MTVSGRDTVPASGARTSKGSNYFMLKAGMHIENSDLRVMEENVPVSQSNRINRLLNTSNRSQANTFLRLATQRNDQSGESSQPISNRKKLSRRVTSNDMPSVENMSRHASQISIGIQEPE